MDIEVHLRCAACEALVAHCFCRMLAILTLEDRDALWWLDMQRFCLLIVAEDRSFLRPRTACKQRSLR